MFDRPKIGNADHHHSPFAGRGSSLCPAALSALRNPEGISFPARPYGIYLLRTSVDIVGILYLRTVLYFPLEARDQSNHHSTCPKRSFSRAWKNTLNTLRRFEILHRAAVKESGRDHEVDGTFSGPNVFKARVGCFYPYLTRTSTQFSVK
jgi:hypothetical protein